MAVDENYNKIIHSAQWRRTAKQYKASHPLCEECQQWPATAVHHVRPLETASDFSEMLALAYDLDNLEAVCENCHTKLHNQLGSHSYDRNKELVQKRNRDRADQILSLFEE